MKWDDYYEKTNDWAVSTAVQKISSLEDMGEPDEIVDVLVIIAFEDKKGAVRLLNRALQHGVKFSGENLVEIESILTEESFKKALYQSADGLTSQDLEDMYGCIDDRLIVDVAKRYQISVPADLADEYAEELCPDVTTPIMWSRFYNAFYDWNREYAITRSRAISDFGNEDEVMEVIQELFSNDKYEASRFVGRVLNAGVRFRDENLVELTGLCNEDTIRQAVLLSSPLFNEDSLEELYGNVSDDIIIEAARRQNIKLPEGLRAEEEEIEDISFEISSAIQAADYALACLVQAQRAINHGSNVSFIDMVAKGPFTPLWKYSSLSEADVELRNAQSALQVLNTELRNLSNHKSVRLKYARLASVIDMWFDSGFVDVLVHLQINKAQKRIRQAITRVENIRRELGRLL
ncbi:MAG: hypothetical protein J6C84_07970 [Lachnospiraceae bacterium]|nr:hypothetical protein [Lachnospiraceae bacterium]